ncbi:Hypothetical predicted protein [Octopus vulgaris]|uniref:Uncharacterized protein n=1 Tax=Octopus vulgaris TaxID=6645 RepID=A0AA36BN36_OCTVU|nr:Hypothetical predicted protein [Octopus vulgaris]
MMSSGYLTVAEGSWGSSRLPRKLLMSVMLMIVMMYSYTSAYVEIISYSPADGFTVGREDTLDISCLYNTNNPDWFTFRRNYTVIAKIEYNERSNIFEIKMRDNDFSCTLNQLFSEFGVVNCRKKNLNRQDVGSYSCWLKDGDHSSIKFLTVFNQTRTEIIDPRIIIASSAPSGIAYTKCILVVNLILLLLVAAISR